MPPLQILMGWCKNGYLNIKLSPEARQSYGCFKIGCIFSGSRRLDAAQVARSCLETKPTTWNIFQQTGTSWRLDAAQPTSWVICVWQDPPVLISILLCKMPWYNYVLTYCTIQLLIVLKALTTTLSAAFKVILTLMNRSTWLIQKRSSRSYSQMDQISSRKKWKIRNRVHMYLENLGPLLLVNISISCNSPALSLVPCVKANCSIAGLFHKNNWKPSWRFVVRHAMPRRWFQTLEPPRLLHASKKLTSSRCGG